MITLRPERVTDYADIADLHARAFGARAGKALIVALIRQRSAFDPALSLVAEVDGRRRWPVYLHRARLRSIWIRCATEVGHRDARPGPWHSTWHERID